MTRQNVRAKARGLGAELADLRQQAGMTLRDVAGRLGWSAPTLCRIENGTRDTTTEEVAALLVIYKITGARNDRLVELARTIDQPGWWETSASGLPGQLTALCAFEAEATKITDVCMILVPGLLQTAEYARAVMDATVTPGSVIDARLAVRLGRQGILSRRHPPAIHTIIDEAVLHRPLGGPRVMAEQLRHIIRLAAKPHVTVRVLRQAAHPALAGTYLTLEFPPPARPFVHLEHMQSSMFLDEAEDVDAFLATTATLADVALEPAHSRDFLAYMARRYEKT